MPGGRRYCCVPLCHNHSGMVKSGGTSLSLHRVPKDPTLRRLWLQRLATVRKDLNVTDGTRVCSEHFLPGERIPTSFPSKPAKEQNTRSLPTYHANTVPENVTTLGIDSESGTEHAEHASIEPEPTPEPQFREVGIQCNLPVFAAEDLNQENVRFYTGFVNVGMFMALFATLMKHGGDRLMYWHGDKGTPKVSRDGDVPKRGRKRQLRPIDEFLLVCMKLRLGLLQRQLADMFCCSESSISRIVNTWINFIFDHSKSLIPWVTKEQILCNLPSLFSDYGSVKTVLDCTEFYIEKPTSLVAQWQTWSEYKQSNTVKVLIGVTPSGLVNFVSRVWGGRASDRQITSNDNLLALLEPGDVIMADKGFTVGDLLAPGIGLNVPPRIGSSSQMSTHQFFQTQQIASARIVVEMKMEQIKNYRALQGRVPLTEAHLLEQMIFICSAWTNFLPPLLQ